ncbi:MAG: hypothetical protein LBV27_03920 [Oscillospiraceae bacterium]|nr:hypothetical protein [Oscillospiraceae bacterium]
MAKNKKMRILYIIMVAIFSVTFYFGIIVNPNFNIYDFCMNLSSEVLGLVIAIVLVDTYVREKRK